MIRNSAAGFFEGAVQRTGAALTGIFIPNPVSVNGIRIYWHDAAYREAIDLFRGAYERETVALAQRLLHPGMSFVDLGASLGYYSLLAAQAMEQQGRVFAFEPQPASVLVFRRSIEANRARIIRIIPCAVSDRAGEVELYFKTPGQTAASTFRTRLVGRRSARAPVKTVSLDEFFAGEGDPVHLVKMDIEGAEKKALEGMRRTVRNNPGMKLIIEFHPSLQKDAGVQPEELFGLLNELGFTRYTVIREPLRPVRLPQDTDLVVRLAGKAFVNLLCEQGSSQS